MTGAGAPRQATGLGGRIAALFLVRVVALVAGFFATVAGARLLGTEAMGAVGQAMTVASISAMLANLGLNIAAIYALQRDPADAERTVARLMGLGVVTGVAAVVIAALAILATVFVPALRPQILITAVPMAVSILIFELAGSLLLGLDRQASYVRATLLEGVGSLAFTLLILFAVAGTADGFMAAAILGYLLGAGYAFAVVRGRVGSLRAAWDGGFSRRVLAFGVRGQAGNIIQFMNLRLDLLLVPALLGLAAAGVYAIAVRVSETVLLAATSAGSLLFPAVAGQADARSTAVTEGIVRATLLVVAGGAITLSIIAAPLLSIAFGPAFESGAAAVRITAAAMLPLALFRLLAGDLKGRGRPGLVSIAALIALAITIVGNVLLVPRLGIDGAALTSLVAYGGAAAVLVVAYRLVTGGSLLRLVPTHRDALGILRTGREIGERTLRRGAP